MRFVLITFLLIISMLGIYSCAPKPKLEVPEPYKAGQKAFHKVCSNCHGSDAMGKHTQAPRLIDEEYLAPNFADEEIRETIINGTDKMPPQRKNVTDKEITEIIKYLRYSQKTAGLEPEEEEEGEES